MFDEKFSLPSHFFIYNIFALISDLIGSYVLLTFPLGKCLVQAFDEQFSLPSHFVPYIFALISELNR